MTRSSRLSVALLIVIALAGGWQLGVSYEQFRLTENGVLPSTTVSAGSGTITDPQKQADLSLLWSVWQLLLHHYIDPSKLTSQSLVEGAAAGLTRAVGDPYTVFMNAKESTAFQQVLSGDLEGIGAELKTNDQLIVVAAPLKGSPAEKAGLLPNDIITAVDGQDTEGLSLGEVVTKIRGPRGTSVTLTVYRLGAGKPLTFTIVRQTIHIPSVESSVLKTQTGSVGILTLNEFGDTSMDEVRTALANFKKQPLKALVLDLRGNGGGYLEGAVDLASMFLTQGTIVSVNRRDLPPETHAASGQPLYPDIPMAVLINEGSASASEIVAGALHDLHRATLIGQKSFGKGSVQEIYDLSNGDSMRITIAEWYTPNGKNIGKEGIQPDIKVDFTADDVKAGKDSQLDAAVSFLTTHRIPTNAQTGSGVVR